MSTKNIKLLVIVGVIVILALSLLYFFSTQRFKLVSTSPDHESMGVDFNQTIDFTFSKKLDATKIGVFKSKPFINAEVVVDGQTISLQPTHTLLEETEYIVTLPLVTSVNDDTLHNIELTFTTGIDDSPRAQFIRSLPIYKTGYNITYTKNADRFVVQVTSEPRRQHIEEAREFLNTKGVNDSNDNIKIEILRSLEGSGSPPG